MIVPNNKKGDAIDMAFEKQRKPVTKNEVCEVFEATQELSKEELQVLVTLQWVSQQYKSADTIPVKLLVGKSFPAVHAVIKEYDRPQENSNTFKTAFDSATTISEKYLKDKTVCMSRIYRVLRELNTR